MKKIFFVILGATLMGLSLNLFLIPAQISAGGVSGLSLSLNKLFGVPVSYLIFGLNIPLFVWGLKNFDKKFLALSFLGMSILSLSSELFVISEPLTEDRILMAVFGGVLSGLGMGIVFRFGGTTGGADIIVKILKKKYPSFSTGTLILIIDAFTIALAGIVFRDWNVLLYSVLEIYIATYVVDIVDEGINLAKLVLIISDFPAEISTAVSYSLSRGATILTGYSQFSGNDKTVILCVVKKHEVSKLKNIVKDTDRKSFVIISDAKEVLGNGFVI